MQPRSLGTLAAIAARMMNSRLVSILPSFLVSVSMSLSLIACASNDDEITPDGAPAPTVVDPSGRFVVHSAWTVAPPPGVTAVLAQLTAATDGPDDPSRFLIDHLVAGMDDGWTKTLASTLTPYVAAYVNFRIGEIAPGFAPGIRALAAGLDRSSKQFGTEETLAIGADGRAQRVIAAARFDETLIDLARITVDTRAVLDGDRLTIAGHTLRLPHGDLVRAGFARAVIPSVVPGTCDLAEALIALVDCDHLGALIAERLGVGSAGFYAEACRVGVMAAAAEIDERLVALDGVQLELDVSGVARGLDHDGNGAMDTIEAGTWTGPSGTAIFSGSVR